MEANVCDVNHLDADVLLPPRKRLLAGLKKQNCDINTHTPSPSSLSSPYASSSGARSEFEIRLNRLLRSHLSNHSLSNEEIIEASRVEAAEAAKAARTARSVAEEKAAKAAKAIAAAKAALELFSNDNGEAASRDSQSKKNKTKKKHVAVHTLYNKDKGVERCRTDEELAKNLHRAMNSSPRISKSSNSVMKNHKHKKLKTMPLCETSKASNGVARVEDSDSSVLETNNTRSDLNIRKVNNKADRSKMKSGESLHVNKSNSHVMERREEVKNSSKEAAEESMEDLSSIGKKKGRFKQKKLPLSVCNIRDQANPKEEVKSKSSHPIEENMVTATTSNKSLFPVERTPAWKCQTFKAPTCIEQNKVMQS